MKMRSLYSVGILTFVLSIGKAFADPGIPVRVTYTDCGGISLQCDYTPGKSNKLSPNSCGYKVYQKLLPLAQKINRDPDDNFAGREYLNLKVSDPTGDKIGLISVSASESGTGMDNFLMNTDSGSESGIPCNVELVTSTCYHYDRNAGAKLPKPGTKNSDVECQKFLDQITADHLYTLLHTYPGQKKRNHPPGLTETKPMEYSLPQGSEQGDGNQGVTANNPNQNQGP